MKNIFIIVMSICLMALNFSCKKDTVSDSINVNGKVQQQGITTYQYGTHILTNRNGGTIYVLRSSEINLDNYINKEVEITGYKITGYPIDGGPDFLEVSAVK